MSNQNANQNATHSLWFCNWKIWLAGRQRLDAALAPLALRSREFWLMSIVRAQPVSQQELAGLAGVDPSSLVALLDELEAKRLLRRRRNPGDRRIHLISLTAAGEALLEQAQPLASAAEAKQLAALTAAERARLLALLQKLIAPESL